MLRILHIDSGREMRGGQWQALFLHRGLAEAGHESVLLAPADSALFHEAWRADLPVLPLTSFAAARASRKVDLTHAHDARSHAIAALLGRRPLVVSRRVAFAVKTGPISRWKYSRADCYIAVSQFVAKVLARARIPESRIRVVYDGVPIPAAAAERNGPPVVIAPHSNDPMKGAALVREAAARIGVPVQFSTNLADDLVRASMFVYITHEEGLGSGVLLAMAHGVPVIASRIGGLPEVVEDGRTGLLTENDADAIGRAIIRLTRDEPLRSRLAGAASGVVRKRFSAQAMVDATVRVYEEVLEC